MSLSTLAAGLVPSWAVFPLAVLAMLVVAGHVLWLPRAEMPASRRRIRIANGLLMLFALPLAAYALGIADPSNDKRGFVMAWMLVSGMVTIVLLVALVDLANTWRLHRRELRGMILEMRSRPMAKPDPKPSESRPM
ncbi:MAG: hypothetical protein GC200_03325 [Tepidisphaera sp.]|nr:hypothetical protein [Tepidisphaera sp.]